jgi:hypothetical protein
MSDYKFDSLDITVKDAAGTLADLLVSKTTFANVSLAPQNKIFSAPPQLDGNHNFPVGQWNIGVDASASYQASAFRKPNDTDPDGVVTVPANGAWLKQELALAASVQGSDQSIPFGLANAKVGVNAGANARLLDYRLHSLGDPVGSALETAILGARFAFRDADINLLDGSSRLALIAGGNLALSASITFADTLSASLAALDDALKLSQAVALNFQTGASLALAASLSDDFRVVFSRAATSGNIGVAIHKAAGSNVKLTGNLGVNVGLADQTKVAELLDVYIQQRLGVAYADFQKLEQEVCNAGAGTLAAVPADLQGTATKVAQYLGLGALQQDLGDLKTRICGAGKKLHDAVENAVHTQVTAQFTLSWSRVSTDDTVLAFEVDPTALEPYLAGILFGNLAPVLRLLAPPGDRNFHLLNYLDTRTVCTGLSFGFTLNLGKWSFGSTTSFQMKVITETSSAGQRISLDGRNSYTGSLFGESQTYFLDLSAAMSVFKSQPQAKDFLTGLHLSWTWKEKPSSGLADKWADLAAVWGLADGLARSVPTKGNGNADAAVDLVLSDAGLRALAKAATDPKAWNDAWTWAMVAALPGIPGTDWRGTVQDRQRIYGKAAIWTLDQLSQSLKFDPVAAVGRADYYTSELYQRLMPIDLGATGNPLNAMYQRFGLAALWQPLSSTQNIWLYGNEIHQGFAGIADPAATVDAFKSALSNLHDAVNKDPFCMRIVGAAIVQLLRSGQTHGGLFTATARFQWNGKGVVATAAG